MDNWRGQGAVQLGGWVAFGASAGDGVMLKEAVLSDGDIADILGQSGTAVARHYSREADLPETSKAVVAGIDWAGENRSKAARLFVRPKSADLLTC